MSDILAVLFAAGCAFYAGYWRGRRIELDWWYRVVDGLEIRQQLPILKAVERETRKSG